MELWIRTQDREVLLPAKLEIQATGNERIGYLMYGLKDYSANAVMLGKYKTKERALEVLDEIQKFIEEFNTVTAELDEYGDVANVEHHKKVYEMPKE